MESFPDDLILRIFSKLSKKTLCLGARLVCTRWWLVSKDASLWKELCIPIHFNDGRLRSLMREVGEYVEELDCTDCETLSRGVFLSLKDIKQEFPVLKKLSFPVEESKGEEEINEKEYFQELSQIFPNLEEVENIWANVRGTVDMLEFQSYFPKLKVVHDRPMISHGRISEVLRHNSNDKRTSWINSLANISTKCPCIAEYRCTRGGPYLDKEGLPHIGNFFNKLDTLELRLCSFCDKALEQFYANYKGESMTEFLFEKPTKFTDVGLSFIATNSAQLKKLKLSRCPGVTREGIKSLVTHCRQLTSLHINNSKGWNVSSNSENDKVDEIDDECIHIVSENCKQLEIFRLLYSSKVTVSMVGSMLQNCDRIQALMFFECPGIDDRAAAVFAKMKHLKRLTIANASITPHGILDLVLEAPCLSALTLYTHVPAFCSDMSQLGEEIYEKIDATGSRYKPNVLRSLTLRGVGSGFLQLITVLSPNLLSLDIRDDWIGITTGSLKSVLINCEYIEHMDLSSLKSIDPSFLSAVAENGKSLRKLSFGRSIQAFNNANFDDVISLCPNLEMMSMNVHKSAINENELVESIKKTHGGYCYLHVDPESLKESEFKHKYISLHFIPLIYVKSIQNITT